MIVFPLLETNRKQFSHLITMLLVEFLSNMEMQASSFIYRGHTNEGAPSFFTEVPHFHI